jgi:hypothetical protein
MKRMFFILALIISSVKINAQGSLIKDTTLVNGNLTIVMDSRLELLAKKEAEINEAIANGPKFAKGYRLMILNTTNRTEAMSIRAKLLQLFPEQKIYMTFQPPHIKVKLGNFLEKNEAEEYIKEVNQNKLVTTEVYLLSEMIEIKTEKNKEKELL